MKFILNYTDYLLESKKSKFKFNVDAISTLTEYISDISKKDKVSQILLKDIFNNYKNFIEDTTFPQKNTNDKIEIINDIPVRNKIITYYKTEIQNVVDYINNCDLNDISATNFNELIESANDFHNSLEVEFKAVRTDEGKDTDRFIVYPNKWYWINLNTDYSEDEKENMGHCGQDSGKILFSLRDDKSQSHITVSYDKRNKTIYQIKGRKNSKPTSKYHKMIVDMLLNDKYEIEDISDETYRPELNFSVTDLSDELAKYLYSKKPNLEYTDSMLKTIIAKRDYEALINLYRKGMTKIIESGYGDVDDFIDYLDENNHEFYDDFIRILYNNKTLSMRYSASLTQSFIEKSVLSIEQAIKNVDFKRLLISDRRKAGENLEYYLSLGYKPSSYDEVLKGLYHLQNSDYIEPILKKYKVCWYFKPTSELINLIIDRDIPYNYIYLFDWSDYMFTENEYSKTGLTTVHKVFLLSQRKEEIVEKMTIYDGSCEYTFRPDNIIESTELPRTKLEPSMYKKYIGYHTFFSDDKLDMYMNKIITGNKYDVGMSVFQSIMNECFNRNLVTKQHLEYIFNDNIEMFDYLMTGGFYKNILELLNVSDYKEFIDYLEKNYDEYTIKKIKAMI